MMVVILAEIDRCDKKRLQKFRRAGWWCIVQLIQDSPKSHFMTNSDNFDNSNKKCLGMTGSSGMEDIEMDIIYY